MFSKLTSVLVLLSIAASAFAAPSPDVEARAADVTYSGTHSGDGTFYAPGLGACGINNGPNDLIVAVSHDYFDNYPGHTSNPNNNPVCGKSITANYQGKSVTVKVVDRCTGCATYDLDFSPGAFSRLADQSIGRIHGVTWSQIN